LNPQPSVLETDALPVELVPFKANLPWSDLIEGMPDQGLVRPGEKSVRGRAAPGRTGLTRLVLCCPDV
jgi:hypothetical protein